MHNLIFFSVLAVFSMNVAVSTGQISTTTTSLVSNISPSPLTASFLASSTPPPKSSRSPDPWQCATRNLTQYFDVPKPSGALFSVIQSYGDELLKPCLSTATGLNILLCTVSETTKWCGFATDAQPPIQTAYSAYGSAAASWYDAKSAAIENVKQDCPITWERFSQLDYAWLNQTIAHAKCYAEKHPKQNATVVSASSTAKGS